MKGALLNVATVLYVVGANSGALMIILCPGEAGSCKISNFEIQKRISLAPLAGHGSFCLTSIILTSSFQPVHSTPLVCRSKVIMSCLLLIMRQSCRCPPSFHCSEQIQ